MTFNDYERELHLRYADFAQTVKQIIEKAIVAARVPRPQSIQSRAKTVASLKARLEENGKLDSEAIEQERKDLAGVRLIFYTNTDVDRFLSSHLLFDNFDVERESTRIHHPTAENDKRRYQAIHYTVKLKSDRDALPEYSMFKGMRCEIQMQTILNHSWSETSHDIAYKHKPSDGFGTKAMESITQRLNRIMDKYLLPAGYEFQRVQHDFERLQQGKALFDEGILPSLAAAADNNELYERLASLKDQVLPNYDDIPAIFRDLIEPLVTAVERARQIPKQPLKTTFGDLEGKDANDVARLVIEILDMLRYVDAKQTFEALSRIFVDEKDERIRKQILDAIGHLSKYDFAVWNQVGPALQSVLVDTVAELTPAKRTELEPLVLCILQAALSSEISGTTWKANSVTLSSGAIPTTTEIKAIRDKAIRLLCDMFKLSESEEQRRYVFSALREATRSSSRGAPSNELYKRTLIDAARIVDFLTAEADALSFELSETIEHDLLFDYHRARELADVKRFGCQAEAAILTKSILAFRDRINSNRDYVRYKTLVGFETVLPEHWDDKRRDFKKVEEFRMAESQRYLDDISPNNEAEWFVFIERCATTKSNDLATFPIYGKFLIRLAESKPEVAKRLLDRGNSDVAQFLAVFLNGFYQSDRAAWRTYIDRYLAAGINLSGIMHHWRLSKPKERKRSLAPTLRRGF